MQKKDSSTRTVEGILTIGLAATALLLFGIMICTRSIMQARAAQEAQPEPVVLEFLSEFLPSRSMVEREEILDKYFSCVDNTAVSIDGYTQDLLDLTAVFLTPGSVATGFRVCSSQKNYLEIMLQDAEGNDLIPRVGIFYRVNGDGLISSYSVTRLQPVSKRDAEWSEVWQ